MPSSTTPSPRSQNNLAKLTLGPLVQVGIFRTATSSRSARNSFALVDQLSASSRHLSDLCRTASPSLSTNFYQKHSLTISPKETSLISSNSSRTQTLMVSQPHRSTVRTSRAFISIYTDRFLDSWRLTLYYLLSTMSTNPDEIMSVKPTRG